MNNIFRGMGGDSRLLEKASFAVVGIYGNRNLNYILYVLACDKIKNQIEIAILLNNGRNHVHKHLNTLQLRLMQKICIEN